MLIGRKIIYAVILSGFYTSIIVFSYGLDFNEVLIPTILILVFSYAWFLFATLGHSPMILNYVDMVVQVFLYSFISFFIVFISLTFSGAVFEPIRLFLLISPIIIWVIIWTDFYFQRIAGKV